MDKFIGKKMFCAKKTSEKWFFWDFTYYCTKTLRILLCCSDDAQTYRIVVHFILEGGKKKIKPQNSSQFIFATSEISRVSRS